MFAALLGELGGVAGAELGGAAALRLGAAEGGLGHSLGQQAGRAVGQSVVNHMLSSNQFNNNNN